MMEDGYEELGGAVAGFINKCMYWAGDGFEWKFIGGISAEKKAGKEWAIMLKAAKIVGGENDKRAKDRAAFKKWVDGMGAVTRKYWLKEGEVLKKKEIRVCDFCEKELSGPRVTTEPVVYEGCSEIAFRKKTYGVDSGDYCNLDCLFKEIRKALE